MGNELVALIAGAGLGAGVLWIYNEFVLVPPLRARAQAQAKQLMLRQARAQPKQVYAGAGQAQITRTIRRALASPTISRARPAFRPRTVQVQPRYGHTFGAERFVPRPGLMPKYQIDF